MADDAVILEHPDSCPVRFEVAGNHPALAVVDKPHLMHIEPGAEARLGWSATVEAPGSA